MSSVLGVSWGVSSAATLGITLRESSSPMENRNTETVSTWTTGNPGSRLRQAMAPDASIRTRGWERNCLVTSSLRLKSEEEWVTIIPVATEIIREGIWDISPSPTVEIA